MALTTSFTLQGPSPNLELRWLLNPNGSQNSAISDDLGIEYIKIYATDQSNKLLFLLTPTSVDGIDTNGKKASARFDDGLALNWGVTGESFDPDAKATYKLTTLSDLTSAALTISGSGLAALPTNQQLTLEYKLWEKNDANTSSTVQLELKGNNGSNTWSALQAVQTTGPKEANPNWQIVGQGEVIDVKTDTTPPSIQGPSGLGGASASSINLDENGAEVYSFTANETVTWSIAGGEDSKAFSIDQSTGGLRFNTSPDFENPTDLYAPSRDNSYRVVVKATDTAGNIAEQNVTVNVTDVNENVPQNLDTTPPSIQGRSRSSDASTSSKNINENSAAVYTFSANETVTWSITGGEDSKAFSINQNSGELTFNTSPDYENPTDLYAPASNNSYRVVVRATDTAGNIAEQSATIDINNLDEDGADDTYESNYDGNEDGIFDNFQPSVATLETQTASNQSTPVTIAASRPGSNPTLNSSNGFTYSVADKIEYVGILPIPQPSELVKLGVTKASQLLAVKIKPEIVFPGLASAQDKIDIKFNAENEFSKQIQTVDIYFEESNGSQPSWDSLIQQGSDGQNSLYGYDSSTGLGGVLLDRDNNGLLDGARLYIEDGGLGDQDGNANNHEILSQVGHAGGSNAPSLQVNSSGDGLTVAGNAGQGLWINLEAISSIAGYQNTVKLFRDGIGVGSVGATHGNNIYGDRSIYLSTGENLTFNLSSNDQQLNPNAHFKVTQDGSSLRIGVEDSTDNDFNDMILSATGSQTISDLKGLEMARLQTGIESAFLDLQNLTAGTSLKVDVNAHCGNTNRIGFVKLDADSVTGKEKVGGHLASEGEAFREAVRANIINPDSGAVYIGGSTTTATSNWTIQEAGIYVPVMISANNDVYTFGSSTASDGRAHIKVLGDNTFGFEDLSASQGSDFDYNDAVLKVQQT